MNARLSESLGIAHLLMYGVMVLSALTLLVSVPRIAHAQQDLNMTIRSAILADPRASSMTPAQIDALVTALAKQAQTQGVTAHDIAWRPQVAGPSQFASASGADTCGSVPAFVCSLNQLLGFAGSNWWPPLALFTTLLLLVLITAVLIEHARKRPPKMPV